MLEPQISTIYCDDIRQESSGKLTFVGAYGPVMIVPDFPFLLRNLSIAASLRIPAETDFDSDICIYVEADGEPIRQLEIPTDKLDPIDSPEHPDLFEEKTERLFSCGFFIRDIEVNERTVFRVVAEVNGKKLYSSKLRVDKSPEQEPAEKS